MKNWTNNTQLQYSSQHRICDVDTFFYLIHLVDLDRLAD